jgi:DNA repair photolyase
MLKRIAAENPRNRWEKKSVEYESGELPDLGLEVFEDQSKTIISENDSPDLDFRFSVNPYRGCAHGCAYCYARPSHEYLGFGSGADFERKILIKPKAPELLRERFEQPSWQGELLVLSGNTDCYQPLEARFELTRRCLAVCAEYKNPVHIITKSALIERDVDLLGELRENASIGVSISIPFWDDVTARAMEPYAPLPRRRMETVRRLSAVGIPVVVHVAPLIAGLSDRDLIPILEAARDAGARSAVSIALRLPGNVAEVFEARLRAHVPLAAEKVLARTREMRGGRLNDPRFFSRMRGQGAYARTLEQVFEATCRRLGFGRFPGPRRGTFSRPYDRGGQLRLF